MLLISVACVLFKQKGKKTVLETYTQSSGRYFWVLLSRIVVLPVKGIDAFLLWHAILHRTGRVIHKSNGRLPRKVLQLGLVFKEGRKIWARCERLPVWCMWPPLCLADWPQFSHRRTHLWRELRRVDGSVHHRSCQRVNSRPVFT